MTVVLVRYESETQIAYIEQDKYCSNYYIEIIDKKHSLLVLKRDYLSTKTAKQAIKKYAEPGLVVTFDYWKDKAATTGKAGEI